MPTSFVNDYVTTLNGAINNSVTSLSVDDNLPSDLTVPFRIRIDDEFLRVTAVSGTGNKDWTVERAVDEPSRFPAASHADGGQVAAVLARRGMFALGQTPMLAAPPLFLPGAAAASLTTTDITYFVPLTLSSYMYVQGLIFRVNTSGSGTVQWGLFDPSIDPTAAIKIAGGSGALSSTGWRQVSNSDFSEGARVDAGGYALIIKFPSSNSPAIFSSATVNTGVAPWREASALAWTDTPDMTSYGTNSSAQLACFLYGQMAGPGGEPPAFSYTW
jgi:hypothetical protein